LQTLFACIIMNVGNEQCHLLKAQQFMKSITDL
jgi:hypothetical protein